jgi:hypothetical protein
MGTQIEPMCMMAAKVFRLEWEGRMGREVKSMVSLRICVVLE